MYIYYVKCIGRNAKDKEKRLPVEGSPTPCLHYDYLTTTFLVTILPPSIVFTTYTPLCVIELMRRPFIS